MIEPMARNAAMMLHDRMQRALVRGEPALAEMYAAALREERAAVEALFAPPAAERRAR